jgi:hypothetical protein
MTLIISRGGSSTKKIDKSDFEKESYLQEYIHKNPESIPVYEIQEDKKLFVAAREFPTESGPIDALAIDKDGEIYIVETKLYKNPDKRTVVAQALDYGASLWKHFSDFGEFSTMLNEEVQAEFKVSFEEKVKELFGLEDEEYQNALEAMRINLREGNIKFVILMDSIDERLKDLILYVNQNSKFDIYAVQMEYYKYEEYEIMVPKIFGVEVKKIIGSTSPGKKIWSKEEFLQDAKNKINDEQVSLLLGDFYEFTEKNADILEFGTGRETGSITYKFKDPRSKSGLVSLITIYSTGGTHIRSSNIKRCIGEKYSKLIESALSKEFAIKNFEKSKPFGQICPNKEKLERLKAIIIEFVNQAKKEAQEAI